MRLIPPQEMDAVQKMVSANGDDSVAVYSKYKIFKELDAAGIWGEVKRMMESFETKSGTMYDAWQNATDFNGNDEYFSKGIAFLKEKFRDIDVDSMLERCIAQ